MRSSWLRLMALLLLGLAATAVARDREMTFGTWVSVPMFVGPARDHSIEMQVRPLYVDGDLKEFTTGEPHPISETQFAVRRAYRMNDRLISDGDMLQPFLWQRGGWILADRSRGRLSELRLPDFDPFYSVASWSQDWVAYCGISNDGEQIYAVVTKLDLKEPVIRQHLRAASGVHKPDAECAAPVWMPQPGHVRFEPAGSEPVTVVIGGETAN